MKKLLSIAALAMLCASCSHQVFVVRRVVPTEHGLIYVGDAQKYTPNGDTLTVLYQASALGKIKN